MHPFDWKKMMTGFEDPWGETVPVPARESSSQRRRSRRRQSPVPRPTAFHPDLISAVSQKILFAIPRHTRKDFLQHRILSGGSALNATLDSP
jgi:hypothetical protein